MKQRSAQVALSVTVLALASALTACQDDGSPRADDEVEYAVGAGDEYVALGDSYTAAPQTGAGDAPDGCYRSVVNYPHRIAETTGVELVDNSCSGANTRSLVKPQITPLALRHAPQLDGVDEDTDLITIRLGANDYGMFARIIKCARFFDRFAEGAPCTEADGETGPTGIETRLEQLESNLVDGVEQVQRAAPDARIIVIGYPQIVPARGTCELLPLPAGDYDYARRILDGFNAALSATAEQFDLTFIDVAAASEGHDICSEEPWVAGYRGAFSGASPWHPYGQESQAVARLVLEELEED